MRSVVAASLASLLMACADDSSNTGEIGWQFDYRDFTDDQAVEDIRDCSNMPGSDAVVPYQEISALRVSVRDPAQQVPGIDQQVDCSRGDNGRRFALVGLVHQTYELLLEAKADDGVVLYRHQDSNFDLTAEPITTVVLPTITGEIRFTPTFAGDLYCPATEPSSLRYSLYMKDDAGVISSAAVLTGTVSPACVDDGFGNRQASDLVIRRIPTDVENTRQPYVEFRAVIEAVDAGGAATYCVDLDGSDQSHSLLAVRPGKSRLTLSSNPAMQPGACP